MDEENNTELELLKQQLRKLIQRHFDPTTKEHEYWDSGNFDDTYEMGIASGKSIVAEELSTLLEEYK